METINIPASKPSRLFVVAIAASVALHVALFAAVLMQPERERVIKYDYLSSAVWEVFGPTQVVKIIEVYWPGLEPGERPRCADVEQALGGLDLERPAGGWCTAGALSNRGEGGDWVYSSVVY